MSIAPWTPRGSRRRSSPSSPSPPPSAWTGTSPKKSWRGSWWGWRRGSTWRKKRSRALRTCGFWSGWVEPLTLMENMRHGIGLRAYGQADPLVAYKREGHNLFQSLLSAIKYDVVHTIYKAGIVREAPRPRG